MTMCVIEIFVNIDMLSDNDGVQRVPIDFILLSRTTSQYDVENDERP